MTHNRTIILSSLHLFPWEANNCMASDKDTRATTLNKKQKNPSSSTCPFVVCRHHYVEHNHISRDPWVACQMEAWEASPSHPLEGVAQQNLLPYLALVEQAKPMAAAVHTYSAINQWILLAKIVGPHIEEIVNICHKKGVCKCQLSIYYKDPCNFNNKFQLK